MSCERAVSTLHLSRLSPNAPHKSNRMRALSPQNLSRDKNGLPARSVDTANIPSRIDINICAARLVRFAPLVTVIEFEYSHNVDRWYTQKDIEHFLA